MLGIDFINPRLFNIDSEFIKKMKKKWCVISTGIDTYANSQYSLNKNIINHYPIFFSYSKEIHKTGMNYIKKNDKKSNYLLNGRSKIIHLGNVQYNIQKKDNKRNSLVYLPFPYLRSRFKNRDFAFQASFAGNGINFFDHYYNRLKLGLITSLFNYVKEKFFLKYQNLKSINKSLNYQNEYKVIKGIRKFCDRNNLLFVVKSRNKFPINSSLYKICDQIIEDDGSQQMPSKIQAVLEKSKIVVGYSSLTVLESTLHRIPFINLEFPNNFFQDKNTKLFYNYKKNNLFNFDGVVFSYSISDFIKKIPNHSIDDFISNNDKYNKYLSIFSGIKKKKPADILYGKLLKMKKKK